jgi:hypothetical protein
VGKVGKEKFWYRYRPSLCTQNCRPPYLLQCILTHAHNYNPHVLKEVRMTSCLVECASCFVNFEGSWESSDVEEDFGFHSVKELHPQFLSSQLTTSAKLCGHNVHYVCRLLNVSAFPSACPLCKGRCGPCSKHS